MKNMKYLIPFVLTATMLASCAMAPLQSGRSSDAEFMEEMAAAPAEPAFEAKSDVYVEAEALESGDSSFEDTSQTTERIVIKNANLSIAVPNPTDSVETISNMAESMGGFVVNSNQFKTTNSAGLEYTNANITIRVPSDKLNEALELIKSDVEDPKIDILNEEISGQDVTREVTDLESRLRNLESAESQLLQIMESATDAEDVIQIFRELTNVREEIEVIEGQVKYYRESARLSAISVFLQAKEALEPITIGGWQPGVEAQKALQALVEGGKYIVNALIWLVIFALPILALVFVPIYLVIRFVRKRKMAKDKGKLKEKKA